MKKIPLLIFLLIFTTVINAENKSAGIKSFKKFILMPYDDSSKDKEFLKFITEFKQAVIDRNITFLEEHTSKKIIWSFADEYGSMKGFLKNYGLDVKTYKKSAFWNEMEKILSLGGIFYNDEKTSIAFPYVFVNFPGNDYDSYTFAAVTGKDVNVRKSPDRNSMIIDTLSYEIVQVLNNPGYDAKNEIIASRSGTWVNIKTASGKEGYIFSYYLHSPIGYRAIFEKKKQMDTESFHLR